MANKPISTSKGGRPTAYVAELAHRICVRLADGETLAAICRDEGMPAPSTVRSWALDDREGFATLYSRARELQMYGIADEILEIADDGSKDVRISPEGRETVEYEIVQRSKLKVDSRKWLLSKLLPKVYGDKIETTNTTLGADGKPVDPQKNVIVFHVNK
jgi:hypothetical protein